MHEKHAPVRARRKSPTTLGATNRRDAVFRLQSDHERPNGVNPPDGQGRTCDPGAIRRPKARS